MTGNFEIRTYVFNQDAINNLAREDIKEEDWPVVYQIHNDSEIYVGETTGLKMRISQHFENPEKSNFKGGVVSVIFNETYNKSVTLDLEAFLIQYFSSDGKYRVKNRNDGMRDHDYYSRDAYESSFRKIWDGLRSMGLAIKSAAEIENSEVFKFSPYKKLNSEQQKIVFDIVQDLDQAFAEKHRALSIVEGDAGTGKSIVITYLAKLLADLSAFQGGDVDDESGFKVFFDEKLFNKHFKDKKIALIIPQQSLRETIKKVFDGIDTHGKLDVFAPLAFGGSKEVYDIALVDEAHLLKVGLCYSRNDIAEKIYNETFGDGQIHTELDLIMKKAKNVVLVYSSAQRKSQRNIEDFDVNQYVEDFTVRKRMLSTQMRSRAGKEYIQYIDRIFSSKNRPEYKIKFESFDVKIFKNFPKFMNAIKEKDAEYGLCRMTAGFAWEWVSKKDKSKYDFNIDGVRVKWNTTDKDWVNSENAANEIGCIHTVQGYDLNYAGVIVGEDLIFRDGKLRFNKDKYYDRGAKNRNSRQVASKEELTDDDLLEQVLRTYRVLMSRGVHGVFIYVCDDELRKYLARYFDII